MRLLLIFIPVLLTLAPANSGAVETAPVDSLQSHFRAHFDRALRLSDASESYTGEDSLVTVQEVEEEVIQAAGTLEELSKILAEGREESAAPLVIDPALAADFHALADALWSGSRNVRARLAITRERAFLSEGRSRSRLELELAERTRRLSLVHELLQAHLDAMDRVSLDTTADRERLVADIAARADLLVGRIRLVEKLMGSLDERIADNPDDAELTTELRIATKRGGLYIEALEAAVACLTALGHPTTEYENILVTHTGDIARGLLDIDVTRSIAEDWWDNLKGWLGENSLPFAIKGLIFLLIMLAARAAARIVQRAVETALGGSRVKVSHLLRKMLIGFSGNLVMLTGLLLALSQIGVNLAPILAGVGVVGFILGFALQETLANFAAGLMILFYRPYDVGDLVEVSGVFGTVNHMSLVSTTILTIDNQTLVVPNGKIWGDVIRNVTAQRIRRVDLVFGISYSDDIPKAEEIMMAILEDHERVLDDPEPAVKLYKLNDSSVDFVVRPWVKTDDYWDVFWDVTRSVKMRFDEEGVSIPFPQRDVHHYVESGPVPVPSEIREREEAGRATRPASGIAVDGEAEIGDSDDN
jgi:small conductance mechanosensitive channel